MITPRFRIEQTDSDLIFTIHAPYASIADAEIYADLDIFCFYASPYYLRLHLPGQIEETDSSKGSYDADKGVFVLCVQKVNYGEHFENLDFITSLLTPSQHKKQDVAKPMVEVIGDDNVNEEKQTLSGEECEDEDEWLLDQCPFEEPTEDFLLTAPRYGFGNKLSGVFQNFKTEFLEVIELPDPDQTVASERGKLRILKENEDFSDEHYLADWAEPEIIHPFFNYVCAWQDKTPVVLSDEELDILKDLPKKEFLLDQREEQWVCLALIDILFAYAYNVRTTLGENTVESAWTINKLSASFSWLMNFSSLREAVSASIRRSLCYPLYRNWDLSIKVLDDVKDILNSGKRCILKSLLEIYSLFNNSEPRYLLNQLYVRDFCIWIQSVSDQRIKSLSGSLDKVQLSKSDVELDLDDLEKAAVLVQMEEELEETKISRVNAKCNSQNSKSERELCKDIATLSITGKCKNSDKLDSSSGTSDSEEDSSSSEDDGSSSSSLSSDLDSDDLSDDESVCKR